MPTKMYSVLSRNALKYLIMPNNKVYNTLFFLKKKWNIDKKDQYLLQVMLVISNFISFQLFYDECIFFDYYNLQIEIIYLFYTNPLHFLIACMYDICLLEH